MNRLVRFSIVPAVLAACAAVAFARPVQSPALNALDASLQAGGPPSPGVVVEDLPGHGPVIDFFLNGAISDADLHAAGVLIGSHLPNGTITARVPLDRLNDVRRIPGLTRITAATRLKPSNDVSIPATMATPNYWSSSPPNFTGAAGANIVVGIVDTGIDWSHDDFKNPNGTTRIKFIWDQTAVAGPPPAGYGYGTQWSGAQIDGGTCTETDASGHGTHVAGSAAGDGSATGNGQPADRFIGMAPRADIIFVKSNFTTSGVTDGVNYIFQKATALGKPAVVNLSLGTQDGPHDGSTIFEAGLASLTGAGRIIVASAGDEGNEGLHAEQLVPAGPAQTVTFSILGYAPDPGAGNDYLVIDAYYTASTNMSVTLTSPGPTPVTVGPVSKGASAINAASLAGHIYIENALSSSASGMHEIYIELVDQTSTRPPRAGIWTITLTPVSTTPSTECDFWLENYFLGGTQPLFTSDVDEAELVSSPASCDNVIAVGAYLTKQSWPSIDGNNHSYVGAPPPGSLAVFSSPGPRSDGVLKPDITAPGMGIVSSKSSSMSIPALYVNPDGAHWTSQGTSMAAPHVTGGVALYLGDNPTMTPAQAKAKLAAGALVDGFTGAVPNALWGYGKLRMRRDVIAPTVTLNSPDGNEVLLEGTPYTITWTASDNFGVTSIDLEYSTDNGGSWTTIATGEANDGSYSWTPPGITTGQGRVRVTAHDAEMNSANDQSNNEFFITALSATPEGPFLPTRPVVLQNRPNPFNPTTSIRFGLPSAGPVRLTIFSATGQVVRRLVAENRDAGWYEESWDGRSDAGSEVASGLYFYKFEAGTTRVTRRMVLSK